MGLPNGGSQSLPELFSLRSVATLLAIVMVHRIVLMIYRVSPFHRLYKFPGPKLAAATYMYEFYFDGIKWGKYNHEVKRLHEIYGPIVRINPDELHCNDPKFIDEIYPGGGRKRNKPHFQLGFLYGSNAMHTFAAEDHELHRQRRASMQKFFSKAQISKLESIIHTYSQRLCDNILKRRDTHEIFDVTMAYSCFTTDVISGYCFGEPFGYLKQKTFEPNFRRPSYANLNSVHILRHFPFLKAIFAAEPILRGFMPEDVAIIAKVFGVELPNRIDKARAEWQSGVTRERRTIFEALFESDLPLEEKKTKRLTGEAILMLTAGTETTSWALGLITFYLLTKPEILGRLTKDLQAVVKDPLHLPSWPTLEKIPYFYAVIQEGIRLSYGTSSRTARVPTDENLIYHGKWKPPSSDTLVSVDYVVPRGAAIGMTATIMNHIETVFPNSHEFLPERWLDETGQRRKDLDRYLISFSKGSRQCLGINLAYCELYLGLAALVLRVFPYMELYGTTIDDVAYDYDLFVPMAKPGTKGVRVVMK